MPKGIHTKLDLPKTFEVRHTGKRKATREQKRNKLQLLPFVAWDGEGYTDQNGIHQYMLFGNSLGESVQAATLDWRDCFPLMLNAPEANHVIYGGTYDVIMITRDMPHKKLERLHKSKAVRYDGYRIQWFKNKWLDVKELHGKKRSMRLYDVMTFFTKSFVKACQEYLGDSPELDTMLEMKMKRGNFTQQDKSVKPYWESELVYLVNLMNKLRSLLHEVGIEPAGWHGPGAVATALLSSHKMKQYMPQQPDEIIDAAERAYYGGRFEQFQVGRIVSLHEYDIRSAYPAAIAKLPPLDGVTWKHHTDNISKHIKAFGLYCVSWDLTTDRLPLTSLPGPLPWRLDNGNIYYPVKGHRSWYWGIEVQNLNHLKGTVIFHECYIPDFHGRHEERPFKWIEEMYEQRATMKEEGNPAQLALKVGMNSVYGKLVQSKGTEYNHLTRKWKKPGWHNVIYGGWISAYVRNQLFEAAFIAGPNMIAIETDAIFVIKEQDHQLKVGTGLGEWEHTDIDEILYVQSGLYYAMKDGIRRLKSRGFESDRSHDQNYWLEIFTHLPQTKREVILTVSRFGSDLRSNNYANWFPFSKTIRLPSLRSKRIHIGGRKCRACRTSKKTATYADCAHQLMVPEFKISNSEWTSSTPYPFPWRKDNTFDWADNMEFVVYNEDIPMEIEWS